MNKMARKTSLALEKVYIVQRCAEISGPLCFPVHSHSVTLGAQGSERGLHLLWGRPQASVAGGLIPRGSTQQQTCLEIDT